MDRLHWHYHLRELKLRLLIVLVVFVINFGVCYYYSNIIIMLILEPLTNASNFASHKIIYTGLTEAFFTYINISAFGALILTIPVLASQIYLFMRPGLYPYERNIASYILFAAPILFVLGALFVFYLVMPQAWEFFLSFEERNQVVPLLLEARISEYVSLVVKLIIAFGLAFQLPVVLIILQLLGLVSTTTLIAKRRLAIVLNFVIAAIITPPDIFSQIALAIPMVLLYECSIIVSKFITRGSNARYQVD